MARILIVDDHEEERLYLWEILRKDGHELLFAKDGKSAFSLWGKNDPDLVVTELYVPEMNGLLLIKAIMAEDPRARVIAFSEISADQLTMAEDLGACCALRKPVDAGEFKAAVGQALEGVQKSSRGGKDW